MKVLKIIGWVVVGTVGLAALALGLGWAVMLLWNWLMPEIFGLPTVTFWQAVGLTVLAHLLFKSPFPGGGGAKKQQQKQNPDDRDRFARRVRSMVETGTAEGARDGATTREREEASGTGDCEPPRGSEVP